MSFATGQRKRGSCTASRTILRPTAWGSMPRRVVSTSGSSGKAARLFDLRFLVGDVLARDRIEFAHFHLVRMQALVLCRHVEVAGAGRGQELDLFTHDDASSL